MLSDEAAVDNWTAWLDDLPLDAGFAEGIGRVQDFISALQARAEAAEAALAAERAGLLNDPAAVHINMLRGTIAKPTVEQIVHLYGREAFQPMIDAAIAQALEKACVAVSEHANWPEDEHGRTEQVGLFARVINAIRAIAALPADRIETDAAEITAIQARAEAAEALDYLVRIYAAMVNKTMHWSKMHIVIEDGNMDDDSLDFCVSEGITEAEQKVIDFLRPMSEGLREIVWRRAAITAVKADRK